MLLTKLNIQRMNDLSAKANEHKQLKRSKKIMKERALLFNH